MDSKNKIVEKGLKERVLQTLESGPMTLVDVSKQTGVSLRIVQTTLTKLNCDGRIISHGYRPTIYELSTERSRQQEIHRRDEWKGTPMPYTRPGSYTPPEKPKVSMISKAAIYNIHIDPRV